jgi:hypothetical protein
MRTWRHWVVKPGLELNVTESKISTFPPFFGSTGV